MVGSFKDDTAKAKRRVYIAMRSLVVCTAKWHSCFWVICFDYGQELQNLLIKDVADVFWKTAVECHLPIFMLVTLF